MAVTLHKKVQKILICEECGNPKLPTTSMYLACPAGHGKLITTLEAIRQVADAGKLSDLKAGLAIEDHLFAQVDAKRITRKEVWAWRRKVNRDRRGY